MIKDDFSLFLNYILGNARLRFLPVDNLLIVKENSLNNSCLQKLCRHYF